MRPSHRTLLAAVALLVAEPAIANDSAASFVAGGLELTKESRVAMVDEQLTIEPLQVSVRYLFWNGSKDDVVTEVAFPIPEYASSENGVPPDFARFSLIVDGKPAPFKTEARAFVQGRECTQVLQRYGVAIAYKGTAEGLLEWARTISPEARAALVARGIVSKDDDFLLWSVRLRYHWTQRFPAGRTVTIEHAYTPSDGQSLHTSGPYGREQLVEQMGCDQPELRAWMDSFGQSTTWAGTTVRYILTTAANWSGPIGKFTLNIRGAEDDLAFTCFDGAKRVAPNQLRFEATDFTPTKDLAVHFVVRRQH
jgi:hypothetical protein